MSVGSRMWSWRCHSYGASVSLDRARVMPRRGARQLLVKVSAAALNPIDHAMLAGYGRTLLNILRSWEGRSSEELPLVVGREFVGAVVGGGGFKAGTRVWGVMPPHWPGSLQEYVVVNREWVGEAPSTMDDYSASGTLYAGLSAAQAVKCAVGGLDGMAGRGGRTARVCVAGLGGAGGAAVSLLAARGCDVTVLAAKGGEAVALKRGANRLIDRHDKDVNRLLREAGPFDAVIDCAGLGGSGAVSHGWQCARYVTLTSPLLRHTDERGPLLGLVTAAATGARDSISVAMRDRNSNSVPSGAILPPHVRWAFFQANQESIQLLKKLAEQGKLITQVDEVIPWKCAGAVLNGERERAPSAGARGKIVLDFRDDTEPKPEESSK